MTRGDYGSARFSRDAIERFPELRDSLESDADLLHPQMKTLADALRASIESRETRVPQAILSFLDEVLRRPDAIEEIGNAVATAFVPAHELRRTATGRLILRSMPERVRRIILEQEERIGVW